MQNGKTYVQQTYRALVYKFTVTYI